MPGTAGSRNSSDSHGPAYGGPPAQVAQASGGPLRGRGARRGREQVRDRRAVALTARERRERPAVRRPNSALQAEATWSSPDSSAGAASVTSVGGLPFSIVS